MRNTRQDALVCNTDSGFNYNKLQAVLCITCSSAVMIGMTYLALRWFG
ncbi:hypothetical protein [Noviherbaspirillum saxi]|nr:hypothetical protein [Noviherbaspirillum saxi]